MGGSVGHAQRASRGSAALKCPRPNSDRICWQEKGSGPWPGSVLCGPTYPFAVNPDIGFCRGSCTGYHSRAALVLTQFLEDDLCHLLFPCLFGK
jgi:hypothetical protein